VQFDPIEAGSLCIGCGVREILDDALPIPTKPATYSDTKPATAPI